jgi:hypothetical protein
MVWMIGQTTAGCGVYRFKDVSIPDSIKTVKLNFIENRAGYVNPQLSPALTEKVRQKIIGQTRLTQTNSDNADWEIRGTITDYSVTTSAISQQQASGNRINVTVHITLINHKGGTDPLEFDITRYFDFAATLTLQAAEATLGDTMITTLSDDIFNRLFSNW